MKTVIVSFLFCIATVLAELTEEQKEMIKPYKDACLAELKLDEAIIEQSKKEYLEQGKTEFSDQLNCFSACMFKKVGIMTEEGKFDEDMARALASGQFPEDEINKAINACKNEVGKDICETAGILFECFLKQRISVSS
uniref:Odorant-binding protein 10 n=1 Tax=Chouioia cunea TaxID=1570515 RepID=A0A6B9CPS1_9HYME|nr:odorant-binding protein 10 [Chouioia cunea]